MRIVVILNPMAKHGRAGNVLDQVERLFKQEGANVSIALTQNPGHAIDLARRASQSADVIAALGGDGTIHEVANGIIASERPVALGLLPCGTGNDFVKMTGTPLNLESAIKILFRGKRKQVDYGILSYISESEKGHRYFVNTAGIGFDAEVGFRASSFKMLPGFSAYLAALISTLQHLNISEARVDIHGPDGTVSFYRGSLLLGSIGNGQYSGGLFRLTPDAQIDDGLLNVGVIERVSVGRILRSVLRVIRGSHTGMSEFHTARAERISIQVNPGLHVHADGEILTANARELEVQIVRSGLRVIVP